MPESPKDYTTSLEHLRNLDLSCQAVPRHAKPEPFAPLYIFPTKPSADVPLPSQASHGLRALFCWWVEPQAIYVLCLSKPGLPLTFSVAFQACCVDFALCLSHTSAGHVLFKLERQPRFSNLAMSVYMWTYVSSFLQRCKESQALRKVRH